jgi:hypothetical protein
MSQRASGVFTAVVVFLAAGCGGRHASSPAVEDGERPRRAVAATRQVTIHVKDMT